MTCSGAYATRQQYSEFWGYWQHKIDLTQLSAAELTALDNQLLMAAGDIHVALKQVGACDCTLDSTATEYLKKLNIINTAVTYRAPCGPRLNDEERELWLQWLDREIEKIRSGKLDLCDGATAADYPAFAIAQTAYTEFNQADLIIKQQQKQAGGG